jgi:hypothetical protein
MHPLLRFYIDGASELVQDDDRMGILIAAKMDGETPVAVLGFLMYYRCAERVILCTYQTAAVALKAAGYVPDLAVAPHIVDLSSTSRLSCENDDVACKLYVLYKRFK